MAQSEDVWLVRALRELCMWQSVWPRLIGIGMLWRLEEREPAQEQELTRKAIERYMQRELSEETFITCERELAARIGWLEQMLARFADRAVADEGLWRALCELREDLEDVCALLGVRQTQAAARARLDALDRRAELVMVGDGAGLRPPETERMERAACLDPEGWWCAWPL